MDSSPRCTEIDANHAFRLEGHFDSLEALKEFVCSAIKANGLSKSYPTTLSNPAHRVNVHVRTIVPREAYYPDDDTGIRDLVDMLVDTGGIFASALPGSGFALRGTMVAFKNAAL